ncbi:MULTISPECIES: 4Fe-4S single cluster domain-containing protein [unclassified Streptomyces]|uniref:4Fe-4S single cluster domain-containing protein n=1 Tax=unclassified Streptomyces TaxID=2593676 RepID=UPI002442CAEB|nr:4Fe-4S single cluster domain-containing protein [Streptomyces sp. DH41]MDG9726718.1 4Fe-4S single cluster domain-containing protein [Streptomyces sp. DH41]
MDVRIGGTHFPLETLGPGRRLGVWFQGCSLACAGCMSRHTWDARGGTRVSVSALLELWGEALERGAEGLTVSGGEPLQQPDALAGLLAGAAGLRDEAAGGAAAGGTDGADLLVYTGYEPDELTERQDAALRHSDAVITGRFRVAEPTGLVWRGSANQRIRPRTPRGVARYAPHQDRESTGARLQAVVGTGAAVGLRLYGVPLRGELAQLERRSKEAGVSLSDPSWRP